MRLNIFSCALLGLGLRPAVTEVVVPRGGCGCGWVGVLRMDLRRARSCAARRVWYTGVELLGESCRFYHDWFYVELELTVHVC